MPQMTTDVIHSDIRDEEESVEEFREFYKKISGNLQFPLLEGLYTINNPTPENVQQFCENFKNLAI